MTTVAQSVANAAKEYAEPIRAAVNDTVRDVRRVVVAGRHAAEDGADMTAVHVRRHPFVSLGIAAAAGIIIGTAIGFVFGRADTRRGVR
jgi:ElaB/YqjD/DUF883 family membrane-anchored ribosome-binding protein